MSSRVSTRARSVKPDIKKTRSFGLTSLFHTVQLIFRTLNKFGLFYFRTHFCPKLQSFEVSLQIRCAASRFIECMLIFFGLFNSKLQELVPQEEIDLLSISQEPWKPHKNPDLSSQVSN